jgi:hypothetical protein
MRPILWQVIKELNFMCSKGGQVCSNIYEFKLSICTILYVCLAVGIIIIILLLLEHICIQSICTLYVRGSGCLYYY